MNNNILNLSTNVYFDNEIISKELVSFMPYSGSSLTAGSQIRIPIQNRDANFLLSESDLLLEGTIKTEAGAAVDSALINNGAAYLFDFIRYEMNDKEICSVYNPGVTSSLIGYSLYSPDQIKALSNAAWISDGKIDTKLHATKDGNFQIIIPLNTLLPIFAKYKKIFTNAKHELTLTRARNDYNAVKHDTSVNIEINKLIWRVPVLHLNDQSRLHVLDLIEKNRSIPIPLQNWHLHTYPTLPASNRHSWSVKSSTNFDSPRFVIFALQTNRIDDHKKNNALFDLNDLSSTRLFLNEKQYPAQDIFFDNSTDQISTMYDMYLRFKTSYYKSEISNAKPLFDKKDFTSLTPIICFDTSRQNENFTSNCVDIRIDFEFKSPIPPRTTAYALLISDSLFEFKIQTGEIKKLI